MTDNYYSDFKDTQSVLCMHRQELNASLIKVLTV